MLFYYTEIFLFGAFSTLWFPCILDMLFKYFPLLENRKSHRNYQYNFSLSGSCVCSGDPFHSFILSRFHFITWYIPHSIMLSITSLSLTLSLTLSLSPPSPTTHTHTHTHTHIYVHYSWPWILACLSPWLHHSDPHSRLFLVVISVCSPLHNHPINIVNPCNTGYISDSCKQ